MARLNTPALFRLVVLTVLLASGLFLSGCASTAESDGGSERAAASNDQPATTSGSEQTLTAAAPIITEPEPEPEPKLTPVPDPTSLVGYNDVALVDLFGLPSFTRQEPPAELWQYRNNLCTLDLFLYETSGGGYSVEHLEFRETGASANDVEDCLRAIIENKADAVPSA